MLAAISTAFNLRFATICLRRRSRQVDRHGGNFTLPMRPVRRKYPLNHNRQIVVLPPADWRAWLGLTKPEAELLRPSAAGTFKVETGAPAGGGLLG